MLDKIESSRRGFFGFLGAAPLAAKAAAEQATAALSGLSLQGVGHSVQQMWGTEPQPASFPTTMDELSSSYGRCRAYVRAFGMPKFFEDEFRERNRQVEYLDHDIASKRSWSLAVKIQHQRERNYQRMVERVMGGGSGEVRRAFHRLAGFYWPWS